MYGHQIIRIYNEAYRLSLTTSPHNFSKTWLGRDGSYIYDLMRRDGLSRKVRPDIVEGIKSRLASIAELAPTDLACEVRLLEKTITRDEVVASLLGRASSRIR